MEDKWERIGKFFFKTMSDMRNYLFIDFFKKECATYGINKNQYKTILMLKHHGSKSMTALCSMLQLEKGSFTTIIDYLTEKGYVIRTKDEKDRRKYLIKLTEVGDRFAEVQKNKLDQHLSNKLDNLSRDDMKRFVDAIKILEEISKKL
ncbi:MarR family winged helix-turn-helix transcriptional regulator [Marinisporobacter balticus]|uniref:DNA-binding MarR family transcriptional regulator n=1 Tax=Marinisporobacter balticus TaxID=2018667 RepID=A0A4R2L0N1_9FIRM|nr:MarR family transcriptional regulator [Marinisporobacter balticus]TCO79803.1 DNA-binding MarR family transcriptional regulator [Marinisporobacter balticus]